MAVYIALESLHIYIYIYIYIYAWGFETLLNLYIPRFSGFTFMDNNLEINVVSRILEGCYSVNGS